MIVKAIRDIANQNNSAPFIIYEVAFVRSERRGKRGCFKKLARFADHSVPLIWCCSHEHASLEEAAYCGQTPFSGAGEFQDRIRSDDQISDLSQ